MGEEGAGILHQTEKGQVSGKRNSIGNHIRDSLRVPWKKVVWRENAVGTSKIDFLILKLYILIAENENTLSIPLPRGNNKYRFKVFLFNIVSIHKF